MNKPIEEIEYTPFEEVIEDVSEVTENFHQVVEDLPSEPVPSTMTSTEGNMTEEDIKRMLNRYRRSQKVPGQKKLRNKMLHLTPKKKKRK